MRNTLGQCRFNLVHQLLIEHIALRDSQHTLFVQHFGIERTQLIQQYFILLADIIAICRNHEQQQRVTLDMTQKPQSQSFSLTGSLDDARYVRHHE